MKRLETGNGDVAAHICPLRCYKSNSGQQLKAIEWNQEQKKVIPEWLSAAALDLVVYEEMETGDGERKQFRCSSSSRASRAAAPFSKDIIKTEIFLAKIVFIFLANFLNIFQKSPILCINLHKFYAYIRNDEH